MVSTVCPTWVDYIRFTWKSFLISTCEFITIVHPRPATFISTSICQLSGSNWLGLRYSPSSKLGD